MLHLILAAALLTPLPAPARSFDAGSTHVDVYGSGPQAVVVIPGLACGPWEWSDEIARLAHTDTVYALTLSGFDGRPYTIAGDPFTAFDSDFETLLSDEHLASVELLGHSLGGTLAIDLAEKHPAQITRVVALDGLPVFPTLAFSTPAARAAAAAQASSAIANETPAQLLAYETTYMRSATLKSDLGDEAAKLEAKSSASGVAAWLKADLSDDTRPDLPRATMPILELMPYASPSPYTQAQTLGFYQTILHGAPHATVMPIVPARHFAMFDRPRAVESAIDTFFDSTRH